MPDISGQLGIHLLSQHLPYCQRSILVLKKEKLERSGVIVVDATGDKFLEHFWSSQIIKFDQKGDGRKL